MIGDLDVNDLTPGIHTEDNIAYQASLTTKPNIAYKKVQKGSSNNETKFIASVFEESYPHNGKGATAMRNDPPDYDYILI